MSFFDNVTTDGVEREEDRVGGYQPLDSGIYEASIKAAWIDQRDTGSIAVQLVADINGKEYTEALWYVSKAGLNYYEYKGKKRPLKGFTVADDICFVTTEKGLTQQTVEDRVVEVYDSESKQRIQKKVPTLIALTGKKVNLAILKEMVNKNVEQNGKWVPGPDFRTVNAIDKVMHNPTGKTVNEAKNAQDATFGDKWLKANKDKVRDNRKNKSGGNGTSSNAAPAARASLFS